MISGGVHLSCNAPPLLPLQWCVIKHKIRPLDAMLVSNNAGLRTVSLCGVGFGLAADVAAESEAYRHLGIAR
jgi:hypothetical protein